jgi:UDP-2,3-diacylglucosamine hydrolase
MSAQKQMTEPQKQRSELDNKIGVIAGKGSLPRQLISSLNQKNIKPYLIALNNITDKETDHATASTCWARIGSAGKIIAFFKDNGIKQIIMAGGMKRPSFTSLIPDATGLKLINKIRKLNQAGDNSMFDVIISFLEENGFEIIGVDEATTELVAGSGILGRVEPHRKFLKDIEYGKHIALEIGKLDIGQAVVVQNHLTLGVEGIDGTDALIKRCASLQYDGKGAVLVKMKKPKQDRRIDLPSIGIKTIELLYESGMKGVAVEAGNSLILDKEETIKRANELGVFIYGV